MKENIDSISSEQLKKLLNGNSLEDLLGVLGLNPEEFEEENEETPGIFGIAYLETDEDVTCYSFAPFTVENNHPTWIHDYVVDTDDEGKYEISMLFHDENKLKEFLEDIDTDPVTLGATNIKPMTKKDWTIISLLEDKADVGYSKEVDEIKDKVSGAKDKTKIDFDQLSKQLGSVLKDLGNKLDK